MPAVNLTWHDAKAYVAWLSHRTGKTYRLTTSVEWEYVARAGTNTPYWWGPNITRDLANYDPLFDIENNPSRDNLAVPVDRYVPKSLGAVSSARQCRRMV